MRLHTIRVDYDCLTDGEQEPAKHHMQETVLRTNGRSYGMTILRQAVLERW